MSKSKILIIQNAPKINAKTQNLKDIEKMLEPHAGKDFDLIILPELFAVGWHPEAFVENAETPDNSPTLNLLKGIAQKFNSNVIGGSYVLKEGENIYRNACPFIDRKGNILGQYYKMHLFSHFKYNEGKYIKAGENGLIINSDIGKIGLSICYDIRFPELFRTYAYAEADLLVEVAAWPKYRKNHWETLTKARAIENQTYMIAVSQSGHIIDEEWNLGHSLVIEPYGETVSQTGFEACTHIIEIDITEAKKLKQNFPILKDRKSLPYTTKEILN